MPPENFSIGLYPSSNHSLVTLTLAFNLLKTSPKYTRAGVYGNAFHSKIKSFSTS